MHVHSYTCAKFCCTEIILHCVSVSNQLQQWTNFCTNFGPKKWGEWGTPPPVEKSGGRCPAVSPTFLRVLPTRWRQKSTGIDMEQNYVTGTLCIMYVRCLKCI